ncbi:MAG: GMC family oxidoreductase [Bacteroidia bacterium]|nr:GMC family oxidoreductase [Bacteroidia bacterium]
MATTFDVIVIGSGISGSWAAKEFCEKGYKTLVLERGRNVKHLKDYPTMVKNPWDFEHRNRLPLSVTEANPAVARCYAYHEDTEHFFVKDSEHPYVQEKPFDWIRGYQVGGKSIMWARQTQRWSKYDFEAPHRLGYGFDWPIGYDDLAPWYSHVETFVGISGNADGLDTLPDGEFLKPWEMNAAEAEMSTQIHEAYPDRHVIIGRCANLSEPKEIHLQQGRGQCQARHQCERGCPFGGYFNSNSSTLPWAEKTGNMTLRPDSVVESIIYDEEQGRATGVRVIDRLTKEKTEYFARVIFVNAACLNTNLLLLNSTSERFPNGLGNDSGLLGKYVAFHNYRGNITAKRAAPLDCYYSGRRPTQVMMPNFRNLRGQDTDFKGGYMVFFSAVREGWTKETEDGPRIGAAYKERLTEPGDWTIYMMAQAETLPKESNHVRLSPDQRDEWGMPLLITSIDYDDNDERLLADFFAQGSAMLEASGCTDIEIEDSQQAPGLDIHEMGGVRMGKNPKTSLLNEWNQLHACKNVFVTDGAAMASTGVQNPSLTFMALTARAAHFAAQEMEAGRL